MASTHGKIADLYIQTMTDASGTAFTDEACTDSGDHLRYQITDAAKRHWTYGGAVTVDVSGTLQTSGYTIERAGGYIQFDSANASGQVVTVVGEYVTAPVLQGYFFDWSLSNVSDMSEITTFSSAGKRTYTPGQTGWTATGQAYLDSSGTDYFSLLTEPLIVQLWVNATNYWEGHCYISEDSHAANINDAVTVSLTLQGSAPEGTNGQGIWYR